MHLWIDLFPQPLNSTCMCITTHLVYFPQCSQKTNKKKPPRGSGSAWIVQHSSQTVPIIEVEAEVGLILSHSLHSSSCSLPLCSIGGESLAVAQNTYAVNWFKGKELNLVFGLQLSMARLVTNMQLLHMLHKVYVTDTMNLCRKPSHPPLHPSQGQHSEHEHHGLGVRQSGGPCRLPWTHHTWRITHDRYILALFGGVRVIQGEDLRFRLRWRVLELSLSLQLLSTDQQRADTREKWYREPKVLLAATNESHEFEEVSVLIIPASYFLFMCVLFYNPSSLLLLIKL